MIEHLKVRDNIMEGLREGRIEGLKEGAQQKAIEDAKAYYSNGVPIEIIAKSQNITIEQAKDFIFKK